jgi:hypothetical protein
MKDYKLTTLLEALDKEHSLILKLQGIINITPRCKAEERAAEIVKAIISVTREEKI